MIDMTSLHLIVSKSSKKLQSRSQSQLQAPKQRAKLLPKSWKLRSGVELETNRLGAEPGAQSQELRARSPTFESGRKSWLSTLAEIQKSKKVYFPPNN